jgi:hypothetical protein
MRSAGSASILRIKALVSADIAVPQAGSKVASGFVGISARGGMA